MANEEERFLVCLYLFSDGKSNGSSDTPTPLDAKNRSVTLNWIIVCVVI